MGAIEKKKKIAIFAGGYLPGKLYGGPVTSIYNFTELLGDDYEIYIICQNHDLKDKVPYNNIKKGWNHVGKAMVLYVENKHTNYLFFKDVIESTSPDLIYINSIFNAKFSIPALLISRQKSIPAILLPRGELNQSALKLKALKKSVYLFILKKCGLLSHIYLQATSEGEHKDIINTLLVDRRRVFLVPNISTVPCHKETLRKEKDRLKLCFVGRIVKNKNLLYAINIISKSHYDISLDIYGNIEDNSYWQACCQAIDKAPQNISIQYKGVSSIIEMKTLYLNYDFLLSPTLFENYGQAIAEAILHDTPVIISSGTTPWDEMGDLGASFTIPLSEEKNFIDIINFVASFNNEEYLALVQKLRKYCEKRFNFTELIDLYNKMFKTVISHGGCS